MKDLTIKGLKTWQSRDGGGYQYTLYEGKKKVLFVHDEGRGGCLDLEPLDDGDFLKRLRAYCETLPPQTLTYEGLPPMTIKQDEETFLSDLLQEHEGRKQIERAKKKGICFRPTGEKENIFYTLRTLDLSVAKSYLDGKYPQGYAIL